MKMNTKTQKSGVKVRESVGSRIFTIINTLILAFLALICILPLINILAISLSSNAAATAGLVKLLPVDFTLKSYEYVAKRAAFWKSLGVTVIRCLLGVSLNVIMCVLVAYPLSKDNRKLKLRTVYTWFFFITMLINAGLIPWYMTIKSVHLGAGASGSSARIQRGADAEFFPGDTGGAGGGRFHGRSRPLEYHGQDLCAAVQGQHCHHLPVRAGLSLEFLV